jgi:hypothetical protein
VTTQAFDVAGFLEARRAPIVDSAGAALTHRGLEHYRAAGAEVARERLAALFDLVVRCCREHRIEPAMAFGQDLARQRQAAEHTLAEVQAAINTLEESVWHAIVAEVPGDELGYALGLVSTVLGTVKDRLACTYVAQVASRPPVTLRLDHLFEGFEGDVHPV